MLKTENIETYGWEAAIRGMRNPLNSWEKSDSVFFEGDEYHNILGNSGPYNRPEFELRFDIGENDKQLMRRLSEAGPVHAKFRRMLTIIMDITAPLYWWKEFDTYKVGTVANSCSTMHKIHDKEFEMSDFSREHLITEVSKTHDLWISSHDYDDGKLRPYNALEIQIEMLNSAREAFLKTKDKRYWWQMIQLLPSSYNQKRTVMLNYEVAANIYKSRKDHKLDEWHTLCDALKSLPMSELITGECNG